MHLNNSQILNLIFLIYAQNSKEVFLRKLNN